MLRFAPRIGQLSNRQFRTEIDRLVDAQGDSRSAVRQCWSTGSQLTTSLGKARNLAGDIDFAPSIPDRGRRGRFARV
jgi:hypothetical protein